MKCHIIMILIYSSIFIKLIKNKAKQASNLYYTVEVVAHGELWHITHEVIQPVIQTGQYTDRLVHVSEMKNRRA